MCFNYNIWIDFLLLLIYGWIGYVFLFNKFTIDCKVNVGEICHILLLLWVKLTILKLSMQNQTLKGFLGILHAEFFYWFVVK